MKVFVTASDGVSGRRLVPALLGAESRGTGMTYRRPSASTRRPRTRREGFKCLNVEHTLFVRHQRETPRAGNPRS